LLAVKYGCQLHTAVKYKIPPFSDDKILRPHLKYGPQTHGIGRFKTRNSVRLGCGPFLTFIGLYEGTFKIFRTGAAICTAVVVER
jgi:hypothetical protein